MFQIIFWSTFLIFYLLYVFFKQYIDKDFCIKCGHYVGTAKYCSKCGRKNERRPININKTKYKRCPECNSLLYLKSDFCSDCGTSCKDIQCEIYQL